MLWKKFFIVFIIQILHWVCSYSEELNPTLPQPTKWISEIFEDAEINFNMNIANNTCRTDFNIYQSYLMNQTVWAVRMFESNEWPVIGLLAGRTVHLGNYGECLKSTGPNIGGQYCIVEAKLNFSTKYHKNMATSNDKSAWTLMKESTISSYLRPRLNISWAMCIPSTCTSTDLQMSLNFQLIPLFQKHGIQIRVLVDPLLCQIDKPQELPSEYSMTKKLIYLVIVSVVFVTLCDSWIRNSSTKRNQTGKKTWLLSTFQCYSIWKSMDRLSEKSKKPVVFQFLKTIIVFSLIIQQGISLYYSSPLNDSEEAELGFWYWRIFLSLRKCLINTLIFISGYSMYLQFQADSKHPILSKWYSYMPTLGIIILYWTTMFPHMSDGPFWKRWSHEETRLCRMYWWKNLLGINSSQKSDTMCYPASFYAILDLQLFSIGTIMMKFIKNEKKRIKTITYTLSSIVMIQFIFSYFSIGSLYEYPIVNHLRVNDRFDTQASFHPNSSLMEKLAPYLAGFLWAHVIARLHNMNFRISNMNKAMILIISSIFTGLYHILMYDTTQRSLTTAIFVCSNDLINLLPFAIILGMYFASELPFLDQFFSWQPFIIMERLSHNVLLMSAMIQLYHYRSQRSFLPSSNIHMYWWTITDLIFSITAAFFLYIFVEGPCQNLVDLYQQPLKSKVIGTSDKLRDTNDKMKIS